MISGSRGLLLAGVAPGSVVRASSRMACATAWYCCARDTAEPNAAALSRLHTGDARGQISTEVAQRTCN